MQKSLVFAIDFDGTLCEYNFPGIGNQKPEQKQLMKLLIELKKCGHKVVLWTNRGDNEKYKCLSEAIEWCKQQGLEFDAVNKNLPEKEAAKVSGPSPKILADYYVDDKALEFKSDISMMNTIQRLTQILSKNQP